MTYSKKILRTFHLLWIVAVFPLGCSADRSIRLSSEEPIQVHEVSTDGSNSKTKSLGNTPINVDLPEVGIKSLYLSAEGKAPQTWYIVPSGDVKIDAKVQLAAKSEVKIGASDQAAQMRIVMNKMLRKVMSVYKEVSEGNIDRAIALADEAHAIDTGIAAPLIIKALLLLEKGNQAEAKDSLEKAKLLDPTDKNIDIILEAF